MPEVIVTTPSGKEYRGIAKSVSMEVDTEKIPEGGFSIKDRVIEIELETGWLKGV